ASIRRECRDHVVVIGERHLMGILSEYVDYYNETRTHLSLAKDAPEPRSVEPPSLGGVVEVPRAGGLHHEYLRRAAWGDRTSKWKAQGGGCRIRALLPVRHCLC